MPTMMNYSQFASLTAGSLDLTGIRNTMVTISSMEEANNVKEMYLCAYYIPYSGEYSYRGVIKTLYGRASKVYGGKRIKHLYVVDGEKGRKYPVAVDGKRVFDGVIVEALLARGAIKRPMSKPWLSTKSVGPVIAEAVKSNMGSVDLSLPMEVFPEYGYNYHVLPGYATTGTKLNLYRYIQSRLKERGIRYLLEPFQTMIRDRSTNASAIRKAFEELKLVDYVRGGCTDTFMNSDVTTILSPLWFSPAYRNMYESYYKEYRNEGKCDANVMTPKGFSYGYYLMAMNELADVPHIPISYLGFTFP